MAPEEEIRYRKKLRLRRRRKRALIRSIYLLPSTATLGNAVCGFAAIYICSLTEGRDPWTQYFAQPEHRFLFPAYFIFFAMLFDALDGRLARFTRHTTDFGGQLDSMADAISFGVAPAILMLQVCRLLPVYFDTYFDVALPYVCTRAIWAVGAIYACCAAIRLARFNVSNQHGEQHHYSFLGLPSPGAAGGVAALVLMYLAMWENYQEMSHAGQTGTALAFWKWGSLLMLSLLPAMTLALGLLMVSTVRYPHVVNRWLRGKKSVGRLVVMLILIGCVIAFHRYAIALGMLIFALWGFVAWVWGRTRREGTPAKP